MAFEASEQGAILQLMQGKYAAILPIEQEWGIRFAEGDWRPRIEHFHDAVRALTSGEADIYQKHSRLSVEHLAYDLSQLRHIPDKPLGSITRATQKSASTEIATLGDAAPFIKMPPQSVRSQIATLYRDYTVFFSALFAEVADRNYQSRLEGVEGTQNDLDIIEQVVEGLIAGTMNNAQAMDAVVHVERDDLREKLQAMLARKQLSSREKQDAKALLTAMETGLENEKKTLNQAHMHYATSQLAVYEQNKDTVKKLASQGLNLAGRFVSNALAQGQGQGKGRGA